MEASEKDYSHDFQQTKPHLEHKTYCIRCRLCRKQLLISDKVTFSHSGKTEACGNCIFLDEDFLPQWIKDEIENSSWTKGRLKCPRTDCTARVGGFDFVQGLLCGCGELTIPAIWIQDGKVDVRANNSNDVTSTAKPSSMSNDESCLKQVPVLAGSSGVTGRVVDGDDVATKTKPSLNSKPSLMSNNKSHLKQMPVLKEEYSRHLSPCQDGGGTSTNSPMTQESFCQTIREAINTEAEANLLAGFDNVTEDISSSRLIQGSFRQSRAEIDDSIGFPQSIRREYGNNTGVTEIRTGQLRSLAHPMISAVKQRKRKVNLSEIAFVEQNIDRAHRATKPVQIKLGDIRTTSNRFDPLPNRFDPLSVEEPVIVKPSNLTNSHTVAQEHLICAVCLDFFYKPYRCPCSHVFCESCLRQLYHSRAGKLKCPICRSQVGYIEPANELREEIRQLQNPATKQRELFEKTAKYRTWSLPPIGPLPFLRRRQTLVPKRDRNLVILAAILLLAVCYAILYILP